MSIKVYNDFSTLDKNTWVKYFKQDNLFINYNFLNFFSKYHNQIDHIFICDGRNRFYGNIFNIRVKGLVNFSKNIFFNTFLRLFRFNFFFLSNSFLTNVKSFDLNDNFSLNEIISKVEEYKISDFIVITDLLFENDKNKDKPNEYIKIEIEEEMYLPISSNWNCFDDYSNALSTKYRKRINSIFKKSHDLLIRELTVSDLEMYKEDLQALFNNVISKEIFQGTRFNTNIFSDLLLNFPTFKVYGYFFESKLVSFSSEFSHLDDHYSYFVGLDYSLNKKFALYERILCESIKNAILKKKKNLIFGRTANEFKSNFGAIPKKSHIYLKINNKLMSFFLAPFLKKLKPKSWIQRFPFKKGN